MNDHTTTTTQKTTTMTTQLNSAQAQAAHTPGPWTMRDETRREVESVTYHAGPSYGVYELREKNAHWSVASEIDNEATANLISAAPEMLAALQVCLYELQERSPRPNARRYAAEQAVSAIARATGGAK